MGAPFMIAVRCVVNAAGAVARGKVRLLQHAQVCTSTFHHSIEETLAESCNNSTPLTFRCLQPCSCAGGAIATVFAMPGSAMLEPAESGM